MGQTREPKIVVCGTRAVESGRPLYVRALSGYWVRVENEAAARSRIARMDPATLWIYGVEK
jgi:hypothetical protein